ncbi:MAG TPA: hypothetical protein VLT79_07810 [Gemmatimonadales bacterium]|nr:hypothetical protein [Gemmatimonadales bacterium]
MTHRATIGNERGIALAVVLLVLLAIAAIAAGAALLGSNTTLINKYHDRLSVLETAADAGLEEARSAVNGNKAIYPDTGYTTLENGATVYNASGTAIPNIKRWTYLGPTGVTSGEFGVYGSVVTVVQDAQGDRVVRRAEVYQESFAKYAYFTNVEGAIQFAAGDQLFGPVFSNDVINIGSGSPKPDFKGPVATAKTINNLSNGNFEAGYKQNATTIAFPQTADLNKLQAQAAAGGMSITSTTAGAAGQATTRIEFVAMDLDGDGDSTDDDEGFIKVYQADSTKYAWWVVADTGGVFKSTNLSYGTNGLKLARNCGHVGLSSGTLPHTYFKTFAHHKNKAGAGMGQDSVGWAMQPGVAGHGSQWRCYLGGADILNDSTLGSSIHGQFTVHDSLGHWLPWTGTVDPRIASHTGNATYAQYLWPITRSLNPNWKGVIYVDGKVAVSGLLRGQVTLAATDNIVIADDIKYVTDPSSTTPCGSTQRDMLGLFSGQDVIVADNLLNDPFPSTGGFPGSGTSPCATCTYTWDDTQDEFIQGVVLALSNFIVENYSTGSSTAEPCGTNAAGRGCLYLTGGVIQQQRGAVGLTSGYGYKKRYSYDQCASANPPPYFPTTGHFARGHYYEVEPTNFNIASYWQLLIPNH